jgi:flagellar motor switch protein FliM
MPLVKGRNDAGDLALLLPIATKFAHNLQNLLDGSNNRGISVTAGTAQIARYPEWRIAQNPFSALLRFRLPNGNDEALVHLPGHLISQIVDLHYGGNGNVPLRTEFTPAELRLTGRLGEQIAGALAAAGAPPVIFAETQTDLLGASWPKSREAITVLPLTAEGGEIKPAVISLIFATETARVFSASADHEASYALPADAAWSEQMRIAAMRVRFPARCVLARNEVPFARLLTLTAGDVLPLLIPAQIPLTVAGRSFAYGSLGAANGRAALMIERIEKEMGQ